MFSGLLYTGYIKPSQVEIAALRSDIATASSTVRYQEATIKQKITELQEARDSITSEDQEKLARLIPRREDVNLAGFINDIFYVGTKNGLVLSGITFGGDLDGDAELLGGYGTAAMSFSVESTYFDFIEFIKGIEQSQQLFDITNVTFSAPAQEGGLATYGVSMNVYWLP